MTMRSPQLAHVNLNQLVALDALLELRNVRRAAERLGVTQSAMSHTLRQLRALLDDPLLVRSGNRMLPTLRAEALAEPLRDALLRVEAVVETEGRFDPATSTRRFTLAASDVATVVVVPRLLQALRDRAPDLEIVVVPPDRARMSRLLESGSVDLSLSPAPRDQAGLVARRLHPTSFAVLACREHPELDDTLGLNDYCRFPHVLVAMEDRGPGLVDQALAKRGRSRTIAVRVPYFLAGPPAVVGSTRLLTAPKTAAAHFVQHYPLRMFDPPVSLPRGEVSMVWHERFTKDSGHRWLRARLVEVTRDLRARRRNR